MNDVKKAYFRCDASSAVGVGHFMRCITLARALYQKGWRSQFLMNLETDYDFSKIDQLEFKIISANNLPDQCDLMIIDHYGLDKAYHTKCRDFASTIMVIDDLANRHYDCDILLDQTYGRSIKDYQNLTPKNCNILCGDNYILLKKEFVIRRQEAIKKRQKTQSVENILINFGSTNPNDLIQKSLKVISKFNDRPLTINVVCSAIAENLGDVSDLISQINDHTIHTVSLHLDVSNMHDFMMAADLAIGAGGTTSWERASIGLPTLLIEVSEDQSLVSQNLQKQGAIKYLGTFNAAIEGHIDKAFESVRDNGELLKKMSENAFKICDGQGVSRVVDVIENKVSKK